MEPMPYNPYTTEADMIHLDNTATTALFEVRNLEVPFTGEPNDSLRRLVRSRLKRPQRHRLLHGFPLAASMPFLDREARLATESGDSRFQHDYQPDKPLLVGVLPHSYCNPKIAGCGFCTFPHEDFSTLKATAAVNGVIQEIQDRVVGHPSLEGKKIDALYFGGATANLTPAEPFRRLCRKLNTLFDLRAAEITLEGVPAFFLNRKPWLLDILQEELCARHFRISMGIQSFSQPWLTRMGRTAFGDTEVFAQVVEMAHSRKMTVSGDLLFNLPGQSLGEMLTDIECGDNIGLDQICLYHLVMFRGLATAWARDPALIAALPGNERAATNWEAIRTTAIDNGYHQATLTNFEKSSFQGDSRGYIYEVRSFEADRYNMIGFGPSGISYSTSDPSRIGLKTMNPESSLEYLQALGKRSPVWNRYYAFDAESQRLLFMTRQFAKLSIDRKRYSDVFGADVMSDYGSEIDVLAEMKLIDITPTEIRLTTRGMFFSDTVASVLSYGRHVRKLGRESAERVSRNGNQGGHM
jgi:oxygen-independent coproporphyrinogen-3 oxidase